GLKLKIDSQGMAMVKVKGQRVIELSVADPSRKLSRAAITISGIYSSCADDFVTIPNKSENNTLVLVNLPRGVYAGKSVSVRL
ncbi:MAG: chondroitin lyase, partial [Candidatus Latescibacterota bacterium]|nr:chondroitin lyase [Candidatus Latescibacterota bacterium]